MKNPRNLPPINGKAKPSFRVGLMSLLHIRLPKNGYALLGNQKLVEENGKLLMLMLAPRIEITFKSQRNTLMYPITTWEKNHDQDSVEEAPEKQEGCTRG